MNLNQVTLAGNLTRDPEMRYTPNGIGVCKFGIASNRQWKTESGEKKEEVTFVDVTCFGKTGEAIAKYLSKGRGIFVQGRLKLDQWEDKQSGQKRSKLEVVAESFQFTDDKREESGRPEAAAAPTEEQPPPESDDVPF